MGVPGRQGRIGSGAINGSGSSIPRNAVPFYVMSDAKRVSVHEMFHAKFVKPEPLNPTAINGCESESFQHMMLDRSELKAKCLCYARETLCLRAF
eukprot:2139461-Rhodomonas_salina.2